MEGDRVEHNVTQRWTPLQTHEHWLQFPEATSTQHRMVGAILLVIGTAGLLGNGLVLFVFARCQRLRSPFNAYIVNLAAGDLCTSLLHGMAAASSFRGRWMFGTSGCTLYAFGVGQCGLLSITTLSAIAVDRCVVISARPISGRRVGAAMAWKVCAGVWVYCLLLSVPPLLGWSRYVPEAQLTSCSWDYVDRGAANRAYYVYLLVLGFILPVTVIICCYIVIVAAVCAHSREMAIFRDRAGCEHSTTRTTRTSKRVTNTARSSVVRTAEIVVVVIILFLLSWTPYAVVTLIAQFGDQSVVTPWSAVLPAVCAKASVVYNPIVYGLSHPYFKATVKQYLAACRGTHAGTGTNRKVQATVHWSRHSRLTRCHVGRTMTVTVHPVADTDVHGGTEV